MRSGHALLAAVLVMATSTAGARVFSVKQAVAYALRHSNLTAIARAQMMLAHSRLHAARSRRMPQISAQYDYLVSNNPLVALTSELERRQVSAASFTPDSLNYPGATRLGTASLSLSWPAYTGGAISNAERAGRYGTRAAEAGEKETRLRIIAATVQAYEAVLAAQTTVRIAHEAVVAAREHAATTARLYRHGRIVRSDALTAAVYLQATRESLLKAQSALKGAENNLALVLSAPSSLTVVVPNTGLRPASLPSQSAATLIDQAFSRRPDIRALQAEQQVDLSEAKAIQARTGIKISFTASTDWYGEAPLFRHNAWSVAGVISKSLYDGGQASDDAAAKDAAALEIQGKIRNLQNRIRYTILRLYDNMRIARQRYGYAARNVAQAQAAVRLIRVRYGEGRTILLDLLDAEHNLTAAREQRLAAVYALVSDKTALEAADASLASSTLTTLLP